MAEKAGICCTKGLGSGLRLARRGRFSQAELAELIGTAQARVSGLEAGGGSMALLLEAFAVLEVEISGSSLPPGTHLGERLAAARCRQGQGLRGLAKAAGISVAALSAMERDVSHAHVRNVDAVARTLSVGLTLVASGSSAGFYAGGGASGSSAHHAWRTPDSFLSKLYAVFGPTFCLDPCSPTRDRRLAPVRAKKYLTADDDALAAPWNAKVVYTNPPYGRELKKWIAKARQEYESGNAGTVILLIPARPDTAAWHDNIAYRAYVIMLRRRLAFDGKTGKAGSSPFPSALVVYGPTEDHVERLREQFGDSWHIAPTG